MNSDLPTTGTAALLELLDPFVPDDFINESWPQGRTGGRHREHTAAQLFRTHLLGLISPVHSLNLLVKMLPEQRAWRKFARLRCHSRVPDVRMLHAFRDRVGVAGLRRINQHLLAPLVAPYAWQPWSVGLIDATDLPAACVGFKKKAPGNTPPPTLRWAGARSRRGKADASWATRNTRCVCGCIITWWGCNWCRWSVG
jgi:hypothetical protein